ncbi:MAG: PAS domain-containing protein [Alphaproteobacteria bacterium]|nr:PAS domain-containing protein [Alphaproteobacteria bacterium]
MAVDFADIPDDSLIMRFYAYWRSIAKGAAMPARPDLDPIDIPKIIPWMFLIDVLRQPNGIDFRYRLVGSRNAELVWQDGTGKLVGEAFPEATAALMRHSYMEVVERCQPLCWQASVPERNRAFIACYRALFPFSADGQTVNLIAGLLMPIDRRLSR